VAVVLSLQGVSKSFGAVPVADRISFDVSGGEAVGIIGPNGAGKTSLFNLISGDIPPSEGRIHIDGRDVTALGTRRRVHLGIARTYQVPLPFVGLTVFENVMIGSIFGRKTNAGDPDMSCATIIERAGLSHRSDTLAGELTLLDRKRLELARALATNPKVLLLDEIAGGLTDAECTVLIALVTEIHRAGVTVIWIEHIVHALLRVVKRLLVLDRGRLIADGDPFEVMASSQVREIYLGLEPEVVPSS
jgi:branched-chain amino acid transport system ATP-binding protein